MTTRSFLVRCGRPVLFPAFAYAGYATASKGEMNRMITVSVGVCKGSLKTRRRKRCSGSKTNVPGRGRKRFTIHVTFFLYLDHEDGGRMFPQNLTNICHIRTVSRAKAADSGCDVGRFCRQVNLLQLRWPSRCTETCPHTHTQWLHSELELTVTVVFLDWFRGMFSVMLKQLYVALLLYSREL